MQLSEHFTLEEFTQSDTATRLGLNNTPTPEVLENLKRLSLMLEKVRGVLGRSITISSGYRCPELNKAVKGQPTSQHQIGCAADIKVALMTPDQVVKAIIKSNIQYDQLIREFDSWVHISVTNTPQDTPRNQTLIIDSKGTRPYATNA
jgi:hypothetical protein